MSLVIAAISKDNDIVVCGEGRSLDVETDKIVSENMVKVHKINDSLIIGHAGYYNKFKLLIDYLITMYPKRDMWNVNNISSAALYYEQENTDIEGNLQFLVTGYENNGTPRLYVINVGQYKPFKFEFSKQKTVSIGDELCKLKFDKENDQILEIENKIKTLIKERTKTNPAINDRIISEQIFCPLK